MAALLVVVGCAGARVGPVTAEEIQAHGTGTFAGSREEVFAACATALRASGYSIAHESAAEGVIVTERTQARTAAVTRSGERFLRRYELAVASGPGGDVRVALTPVLFEARARAGWMTEPRALGAETTWSVDEERAEWSRLLGGIQQRLSLRAQGGGSLEP